MTTNKWASKSGSQNPPQMEAGPNGNISLVKTFLSREFGVKKYSMRQNIQYWNLPIFVNDMNIVYSEAVHTSNTYITHTVVNQHADSVYVSFLQDK
jgi:hypothetical protein